jgi:hypothetical protein
MRIYKQFLPLAVIALTVFSMISTLRAQAADDSHATQSSELHCVICEVLRTLNSRTGCASRPYIQCEFASCHSDPSSMAIQPIFSEPCEVPGGSCLVRDIMSNFVLNIAEGKNGHTWNMGVGEDF